MKKLLFISLFLVVLCSKPWCANAQDTRSKAVVLNALPLGFGSLANVSGNPGLFGNALVPSASVYWTLNNTFCWHSGVDASVVYGKNAQGSDASAIGLVSAYHGIMLRANGRDVTRKGFYFLGGVRMAYVPDVDITRLEEKGSLFVGPMLSVGFETGKIANRLGFIFNILSISPMYRIVQGDAASARSSSWLTAVAFYSMGVNWVL